MATTTTRSIKREYNAEGHIVSEVETVVTTTTPDPAPWYPNTAPYVTWWQNPVTSVSTTSIVPPGTYTVN